MTNYNGLPGDWELVIGLEVHAQVKSNTKLFSSASTSFGAEPNTQVALVDVAFPGMLPVLNEFVVEQAIKTGIGISGAINKVSVFDRKNYFYPDLPQGYQITQLYHPIVSNGNLEISLSNGEVKNIKIERIHLEQDAGKSLHESSPYYTYIDLNRAGIALMEIVTAPDIRSTHEAAEFMKKLRSILRYLDTCDGDMEKGSLRCDANVSVNLPGQPYGTRCEIKNLNSIKHIMKAIEYEALRQIEILESGGKILQETRLYDVDRDETRTMRSKEDANDYRYFPDPDLLPLELEDSLIEKIKNEMPELPDEKKSRYIKELNLSPYDADVICADKEVADYFEEVAQNRDAKLTANWITAELFGRLNKRGIDLSESNISSQRIGKLIDLISSNIISGKIAKDILDMMFESEKDPKEIVKERGLEQITDIKEIEKIVDQICKENQDKVQEYKAGKDKLFGFFVGQVMKISGGKANPDIVNQILQNKLSS
jgi:aspartyl-tRNA(Asn)/glutamyl-tRNA(Gln) amidotransferase subunit B